MAARTILLLGDERLYAKSQSLEHRDREKARALSVDLADTLADFRKRNGFGRAIAAPQISEPYRMIYMQTDELAITFINPVLVFPNYDQFEVWDDCMSFPNLMVKVERYKNCHVYYKNLAFEYCETKFSGSLSELFQHEYDHLDGILAVQKAIDNKSFKYIPANSVSIS